MLIWEEKNTLEWLPSQIVKLLEFPRFLVAPYPGRNERIPDSASSDMNSSGPPVTQLPGSLTNANHIMEDWNDLAPTPADATSLRVGLLHNANNNAASGPWRTLKSPSLSSSASHSKLSYLERVVLEIVESERMYVRDLRSIVENYLGKIIDMQELLLRPEQVSALFGNIEDIYELNSELLQDLDSCHNDPVAVARCFVDRSQDFDIYTQYCNNYPNSVAALTECMRNKQLAKFFRERQEQIRHSLPLGSYLLKPVQRILKYHLLLQEIAKHFDIEEDGYEVVEEAIDTMTCVAWYINDMKRKHEHAVRLQEIQSLLINWKGPDLTTYGELVLEGTFRVHRVKNERTFFLFDKILLITKKRSDHYIYKSHIPCSSLMLIESTRDSLCFTVTHYKHNKQQYNIQAKSGEEKRVWTHHIKRLILENHHAIIPQKAKQAILEMDSYYPARYKYSPERMKKSWSCQPTEDIPQHARQGRRQSANLAIGLKHADSDGALLEFGEPTQPLDNQEEEDLQTLPQEFAEELAESDGSEKEMGPEEEEEEEEEEEDERLVGTEQVADFASSLMAVLHCWHYRANALLFSWGSTSKNHKAQEGSKQCQSPARGEKNRVMETVSSVPKAQSAMELNRMMEVSSHKEHPEESHSDPEPVGTLEPVLERQHENQGQSLDHLEPTGHIEEMKPLSSEEEEEDEEEEEEDGRAAQSRSILPFSVLDQASIIAERFASSLSRRSSLALEEGKGYLTPKLTSRSNSVLSLEGSEKATCRNNSSNCAAATDSQGYLPLQEPSVEFSNACSGAASPGLIEPDRGSSCRRKEFMLSQQDRQLLDKIKSYYDYAEHQDAGFSVRRRESLSYIPKGLVRNSVFRINSLPQPEPEQEVLKRKQPGPLGSSSGAGRTAAWVLSNRPAVGSHAPHSEMRHDERSAPITEAEFRPPAEMIKVWEAMEKPRREEHWTRRGEDVTRLGKANGQVTGGTSVRHTEPCLRGRLRRQENGLDLHEPLLILEDEDLGAITEESAVPSPESKSPVEQALPSRLPWKLMQELEGCEQDRGLSRLHPRIMQLAHLTEAELAEKVKNKVYQLARQYSLRIKGHKPTVHRRLAEMEEEMKSNALADQQEADKKAKGKQRPVLTLNYEQVLLQEASPLSLLSSASPHENKSPKRFSYSPCSSSPHLTSPTSTLSRSPLSPTVAEKFHWPDVRELRSKYSCQAGSEKSRPLPVNRSRSAPEKMMDTDRVQGNHQCSKKNMKTSMKSQQGVIQSNRREASHHSIPKDQALDAQKEFCVTAEASLENSQRVIVMEKLPDVTVEPDESYVQIRSPTSREKISLKAVVERCKAYQDSEEYLRREEDAQEVAPRKALQQVWWDKTDNSQQSLVKNLREKFQTLNSSS
ncbi:pleckstrin homology domain-containing family G member 3 isoform X3 [Sceloporus undulatus]|uniref:pleckstrin homology domain-containing family G member 3 isoform X3 n=1 Tax=Sceloporus undulatus TaxID=8520 RepID=UPI001C4A8EBE|nr:pleckstrin homology domain-containing family G member 3 isoform X3 [Sceloporus undulatus]